MKLARGSTIWVSVPMLLTAFLAAAGSWHMSAVAVAGFVFMLFFHRDPDRIPLGDGMLSPADGKVVLAASDRVAVFMAPSNVHVNRAPLDGYVRYRVPEGNPYACFLKPGLQQPAKPDASGDG